MTSLVICSERRTPTAENGVRVKPYVGGFGVMGWVTAAEYSQATITT